MHRLSRNEGEAIHINALLSALLIAIVLASIGSNGVTTIVQKIPHFCLFEEVLGIHCPGCDMTAAFVALLHFNIYRSIQIQPCTVALVITIFVQSAIRGGYLLRLVSSSQTNQSVDILNKLFLTVLIAFWGFRLFFSFPIQG